MCLCSLCIFYLRRPTPWLYSFCLCIFSQSECVSSETVVEEALDTHDMNPSTFLKVQFTVSHKITCWAEMGPVY